MWKLLIIGVLFIITMNNIYKTLQIYTTDECNLSCSYCYEKGCKQMSMISQPQDYSIYINKLLALDANNINTLETIELWGGEPLIRLQSFLNYLSNFISTFKNLKSIKLSSNFTRFNSANLIQRLGNIIYESINKNIIIDLQISLDGPKEINDYNRGQNITNTIITQLNTLLENYPNYYPKLRITTNSIFSYVTLHKFNEYKDIENWFSFYLNNFQTNKENIEIKFNLFKPIKDNTNPPSEEDGIQYARLLQWADEYRINYPEKSKYFIWPIYKLNCLSLCAAGQPQGIIALSPSGEPCLCHRAVWEDKLLPTTKEDEKLMPALKLSQLYQNILFNYKYFNSYISYEDFKKSLTIYINLNYCPFEYIYGIDQFYINIPLYYSGAMNILMKWSREAYELDRHDS